MQIFMCYVCLTLVTPWTVARQAPLSMGFSRKEYWSGLSCPPPGDLPDPGIEHRSPALQAASLPTEPPGKLRLCAMLLLLLSRFSHVRLCVTPWTAVHQAPPSMGFSRQEYWSGVPLPSPSVVLAIDKSMEQKHESRRGANVYDKFVYSTNDSVCP